MPDQIQTDPTSAPIIPQIKSTVVNALILFVVTPMLILAGMFYLGELGGWPDAKKALGHVIFADVFMTFGWIAMKSPISPRFLTMFRSVRTMPGGSKQEISVMLDQQSGGSATATIDPKTQAVTIESKPPENKNGP